MIYSVGMLCKHFKGKDLLEKNIYRIVKIGVSGTDLTDDITYTGDGECLLATDLVVYANIFQGDKLFAREYSDISQELSSEKQESFAQRIKVQPLSDEEINIVNSESFRTLKEQKVAEKFNTKVKK